MKEELSSASVTAGLKTLFIGQRVIYYPRLTSTMDVAGEEARRGAAGGTVILAGEQTAGRGRISRTWLSPTGSVALSIILYPDVAHLPHLIMLASLAAARAIEKVTGLKSRIKWPNDVLINGKKVCGILIESNVQRDRTACVIVGIGINVNFRLSAFPEILPVATSLVDELGIEVSRPDLVRRLLEEAERLYDTLPDGDTVFQEWRDRLVTLGRRVRVTSGETILEGIAESIARDGSLLLRHSDGSSSKILAGDVSLRDSV